MKISTTLDATLISRSDKWRLDIKIDDQKFSITAERFNDDSLNNHHRRRSQCVQVRSQ